MTCFKKPTLVFLFLQIATGLCAPLAAQDAVPQIQTDTAERNEVTQGGDVAGWDAVGRIDTPTSYCTGTLIASDIVLTAAHCVFDRNTGLSIHANNIIFRAGYRGGTSVAQRRAVQWMVPNSYTPTMTGTHAGTMIGSDVALLKLDRPIESDQITPFKIDPEVPFGRKVSVVSYGRGRNEILSHQQSCDITKRFRDGVIQLDCNVTYGSSGAPVFTRINGVNRIVSVVSLVEDDAQGKRYALGMILPEKVGEIYQKMRAVTAGLLRQPTVYRVHKASLPVQATTSTSTPIRTP